MTQLLTPAPLTAEAFAPYGDVIDVAGYPDKMINNGLCARYHDRAQLDFADGRPAVSLFHAYPRGLPYVLAMMERHPEGSQCFIPMHPDPFLVTVAPDEDGQPGTPLAFLTTPGQAINYHRNTWHGILAALHPPGLFAVIDRVGLGDNLEEHHFDTPYTITEYPLHLAE